MRSQIEKRFEIVAEFNNIDLGKQNWEEYLIDLKRKVVRQNEELNKKNRSERSASPHNENNFGIYEPVENKGVRFYFYRNHFPD